MHPLLLLLLAAGGTSASHFYGTVMTFHPKSIGADGTVTVVLRYKISFRRRGSDNWSCLSGNCGTRRSLTLHDVYTDSGTDWFQKEGIMTREIPSGAPFQLQLDGAAWISSIKNGISSWRAATRVDLRRRSDTGQANTSPQTTIIPAVRVPHNCPRDYPLLAFDPDGDEVRCRYGNATLRECDPCTPPSVLRLSPSCTLSFNTTSSVNRGGYVVQLAMEDFPTRSITLNQTTAISRNTALSTIPLQFVLWVDSAIPSCTEGVYLPKFLPPTPAHRARLYVSANQTLEIVVVAEANTSTISELLFSGPHNTVLNRTAPGRYVLQWMPSFSEDKETHPFCFIAVGLYNAVKYQSELRCVTVTVGLDIVMGLTASVDSLFALSDDNIRNTVLKYLEAELEKQGLPVNATLRLVSSVRRPASSAARTPGG